MTTSLSSILLSNQPGSPLQPTTGLFTVIEGNLMHSFSEEPCHLENVWQQKRRLKFSMVLRILHEVRRTNHYEEEDWSDVAIGEITEDRTLGHLKLTMQSGKCMTKRTERSTIVMGETTENMGSSFLKNIKQKTSMLLNYVKLHQL